MGDETDPRSQAADAGDVESAAGDGASNVGDAASDGGDAAAERDDGATSPTAAEGDGVTVVLIAAVAANGVIGDDGDLPWHLPEDLRHFKETTLGSPVIAGRRTFESIFDRLGEPLPGRTNVVLSRSEPAVPEGVVVADGVDEALDAAVATGADRTYVIGGATVYEAFLERADRLVLTELEAPHEGDTEFPAWPPGDAWVEVERDERDGFAFVTYERSVD